MVKVYGISAIAILIFLIIMTFILGNYLASQVVELYFNPDDSQDVRLSSHQTPARDYACENSQAIMKISSLTNAHGALWNYESYNKKICYDEIFGKEFIDSRKETEPDPQKRVNIEHACLASNEIIFLSDESSAHASIIGSNYPTNNVICYGDLQCTKRTNLEGCETNEKLIVSLSGEFNAHLAYDNSYDTLICCSSAFAEGSVCGNGIKEGNEACDDGNRVDDDTCSNECIFNGGNCELGETLCGNGECLPPNQCPPTPPFACNNNAICEPQNKESCQCADCHGFVDSCKLEDELICDFRTDSCQPCPEGLYFNRNVGRCDPWPVLRVNIIHPLKDNDISKWQKFRVGTEISFNQTIEPIRTILKDVSLTWKFRDGNTTTYEDCLTTRNCNTTHNYINYGHYTIDAIAKEQGGNRSAFNFTDILIYKRGLNVFAIISQPEYGKRIPSGEKVKFNASSSFVAACWTSEDECNTKASNLKPCYEVNGSAGNLYCFNYLKPGVPGFARFNYDFIFKWTFNKGNQNEEKLEGKWNDGYNRYVEFEKEFAGVVGTNHTVELVVKYTGEEP